MRSLKKFVKFGELNAKIGRMLSHKFMPKFVGDRDWIVDDTTSFTEKDKEILAAVCNEKGIPVTLVAKLLDTERQMDGMSRRAGIQSRIDAIFHEDLAFGRRSTRQST